MTGYANRDPGNQSSHSLACDAFARDVLCSTWDLSLYIYSVPVYSIYVCVSWLEVIGSLNGIQVYECLFVYSVSRYMSYEDELWACAHILCEWCMNRCGIYSRVNKQTNRIR